MKETKQTEQDNQPDQALAKPEQEVEQTKPQKDMVCNYVGDVSVGSVLHAVYLTDWKFGSGEYGHIVPSANKIYLSKHQNPHNMCITLVHEMMHKTMEEYAVHRALVSSGNTFYVMEQIIELLDKPLTHDLLLSDINNKMFSRILKGEFSEE